MNILFYLPLIVLNSLVNLMPFNYKVYKPATETQRALSQSLSNERRMAAYRAKRALLGRKRPY